MKPGDVLIVGTGQVGTVEWVTSGDVCVLLRNGDLWIGKLSACHLPQSAEELAKAPVEVDRLEPARRRK